MRHAIRLAALAAAILTTARAATTITYEEVNLGAQGYINNTPYAAAGVNHANSFTDWGGGFTSWSGFAIANHADTVTAGFGNQYSSYAGGGAGGSAQFAVGYIDTFFAPNATRLAFATSLDLTGRGAWFTNTTYTALDMLGGSAFSKKFGGTSGDDPDWLLLTLTGYLNQTATGSVAIYLADYRFADNSRDYILNTWQALDFTPLGMVDEIVFTMSSSDNGPLGMNTPAFFAMDNLVVPEPSATLLAALAALATASRRQRR
jgi:hypothetical protein